MAKSFTKKTNVAEIPVVQQADSESGAPQEQAPAAASEPQKPPHRRTGRYKADSGLPPPTLTFFQRVQAIPQEDWGTRAKIRTYRLAPLIDRLRGSECKFVCIYMEPVTEDKLKADHGSGRYRLYLAYKGAGEHGDKELDQVDIDILDPKFPPNVPAGEWMDDPRNKIWAWGKPPGAPGPNYAIPGVNAPYPQPPQAPTKDPAEMLIQGMRAATELRKDVREELTAAAPPPPPAAPAAPQQVDPWAAAERILNMRSENPMVTILQKQIEAMQATMTSTHEKFEALQGKYFDSQLATLKAQLGEKPKGLVEQASELAQAAEKLKGLFGIKDAADAAAGPIKSKMSGWMELATELVPGIINSPIMNAVAARLMPHTNGAAPQPQTVNLQPQPQPQANGAQPANAQAELFDFVNRTVTPALIEHLNNEWSGADFAEWLDNGYPNRLIQLQTITYPGLPGQGASVIVELYKHSPAWTELQRYPQFSKFVEEFCAWKPEPDDPDEPSAAPASTAAPDEHEGQNKGDF